LTGQGWLPGCGLEGAARLRPVLASCPPDPGRGQLPESVDMGGAPVYFGGGKLAADLTLPKLAAAGSRPWLPAAPPRQPSAPLPGSASRLPGALLTALGHQ